MCGGALRRGPTWVPFWHALFVVLGVGAEPEVAVLFGQICCGHAWTAEGGRTGLSEHAVEPLLNLDHPGLTHVWPQFERVFETAFRRGPV